jgi:hypothetical protein
MPVWCPYCKRRFGTNRGLQQHISIDKSCRKKEESAHRGVVPTQRPAATYLPLGPISNPTRARYYDASTVVESHRLGQNTTQELVPPISFEDFAEEDDD